MILVNKNHPFAYDMRCLAMVFFPGKRFSEADDIPGSGDYLCFDSRQQDGKRLLSVCVSADGKTGADDAVLSLQEPEKEWQRRMGVLAYKVLSSLTGIRPPWGILTGVRPVKLFRDRLLTEDSAAVERHFQEQYLLSGDKTSLALATVLMQQPFVADAAPGDFSLYISIPFCPTRCSYCSFVSHSIEKADALIPPYVELLCRELEETAKIADGLGLKLKTVYMGGGTPTTLSAIQLERILSTVYKAFSIPAGTEVTVEAGRPDTIDEEKLCALRGQSVGRISINPQTMRPEILSNIGRGHTVKQTLSAYRLARAYDFAAVNMDLIAGLPGDDREGFCDTIRQVLALRPENITVHTLAIKRAADLAGDKGKAYRAMDTVGEMVSFAQRQLAEAGYRPYYLYRQKNMLDALENTGYTLPGLACGYNIYTMDETHTVLAAGAGGVTKLKEPGGGRIERVFNYKYPHEYIRSFDELVKRKAKILDFYRECKN